MSSYARGQAAEHQATVILQQKGFTVLTRNWKTKFCEIDIIAQKERCLYFVEVKYRHKATWGSALDYITPKKLRQMRFAAESWVHYHSWRGEYQLAALAINDKDTRLVLIQS